MQATKKITRAMELIAASRIMKAKARLEAAMPYEAALHTVLQGAVHEGGQDARMYTEVGDRPVLVCPIVADRGLCGGYNMSVLRATTRLLGEIESADRQYRVIAVGKKALSFFRFSGQELAASFMGFSDKPGFENATEITSALMEPFLAGEVGAMDLVSTRFKSAGSQVVEVRRILPVAPQPDWDEIESGLHADVGIHAAESPGSVSAGVPGDGTVRRESQESPYGHSALYRSRNGYLEVEPEPSELLPLVITRYVEAAVFRALLEAAASEHSARQRAMAAATDNADELTKTLTRAVNRARQDAITTEIMEIVGGAEALRQASVSGEAV
ncbi:MAG: ATP synthase F1 subunit gamma [Acidimicrobiales bacterium]